MAVAGVAMIVAIIGLSAILIAQLRLQSVRVAGDFEECKVLAQSGVEHALAVIETDPNWRTNYQNDVETTQRTLGGGTFSWKLVDDDGDLSDDTTDPVRIHGFGRAGSSVFAVSALYGVQTDLLTNGDMNGGLAPWYAPASGATLNWNSSGGQDGQAYIDVSGRLSTSSGPAQDIDSFVTSGKTYEIEIWVKLASGSEPVNVGFRINSTGSGDQFFAIQQTAGATWTKLSGTVTPSWSGTLNFAYLYVDTNSAGGTTQDFDIDDARVIVPADTLLEVQPGSWRRELSP